MEHSHTAPSSLRIGVICGGASAEAGVSRKSAREVAQALRASFAEVHEFELDGQLYQGLAQFRPDVVFPVLHGPPGEDGTLQGFLEVLGLPYVGSSVCASACAMNKYVAKQLYRAVGLPVARDLLLPRLGTDARQAAQRLFEQFPSGVVVKPVDQGSAIGVSFATQPADIEEALRNCYGVSSAALVEERISGREITAGVLELDAMLPLPVIEVRPIGGWYDFEHRYAVGGSEHVIPAPIDAQAYAAVQDIAMRAHAALGCRDLSRSDFLVGEDGAVTLLETNTLPGMTATSLYPDAARAAGISFEQLVRDLALKAYGRRPGTP
ncbi:D-alanine--D-alanine ligase [Aquabacterium sp. A7-Y]|uniref:D-alanine--D-alanine ligase family protein n=1 Tax=Aquabacterium sp. A7-Y TaxID=1349605 RepID=UPI00223E18E4|nr:D-alanine--D-alanine ligase [Aquabacterium sp. A7-Y]MCW7537929.1 D-alanine--D-alanine ligase [Aquabacterium sp. A7-Y]